MSLMAEGRDVVCGGELGAPSSMLAEVLHTPRLSSCGCRVRYNLCGFWTRSGIISCLQRQLPRCLIAVCPSLLCCWDLEPRGKSYLLQSSPTCKPDHHCKHSSSRPDRRLLYPQRDLSMSRATSSSQLHDGAPRLEGQAFAESGWHSTQSHMQGARQGAGWSCQHMPCKAHEPGIVQELLYIRGQVWSAPPLTRFEGFSVEELVAQRAQSPPTQGPCGLQATKHLVYWPLDVGDVLSRCVASLIWLGSARLSAWSMGHGWICFGISWFVNHCPYRQHEQAATKSILTLPQSSAEHSRHLSHVARANRPQKAWAYQNKSNQYSCRDDRNRNDDGLYRGGKLGLSLNLGRKLHAYQRRIHYVDLRTTCQLNFQSVNDHM